MTYICANLDLLLISVIWTFVRTSASQLSPSVLTHGGDNLLQVSLQRDAESRHLFGKD